jgi:hypothetical protein
LCFDGAARWVEKLLGDPSRLVFGEQLGCRSAAWLVLEIDKRQLLPGVVFHDKTGFQFLDRPRWREAADALFALFKPWRP